MRTKLFSALLLTLALPLAAQITSSLGAAPDIPQGDLLHMTGVSGVVRSGDEVRGTLTWTILDGWHINSNKPLDQFVIPTELKLDPATADLVSAEFPPHILRSFAFTGGSKLAVYEGTITIHFVAKLKSGADKILGRIHYQAVAG